MKLTLADLNAGISWWLKEKENKWPRDFHNSVYYELYEMRRNGLSDIWWKNTVDRLWDWRAIRSKTAPNTKKEIERRGLQVLPKMQEIYFSLLATTNNEPVFKNFEWDQISYFYNILADIKGSRSPVFPSKLGHFIFPKLFIVMDHQATDMQHYDVFWSSLRKAWNDFDEWQTAKEILSTEIAQHRKVHDNYPFEIKIIELCNIGRKHRLV